MWRCQSLYIDGPTSKQHLCLGLRTALLEGRLIIHSSDLRPQRLINKPIRLITPNQNYFYIRRMAVIIVLVTFNQDTGFRNHQLAICTTPPLDQHAPFPQYPQLHTFGQLHSASKGESHQSHRKWQHEVRREDTLPPSNQILHSLEVLMELLFRQFLWRDEPVVGFRKCDAIVAAQNHLVRLSDLNYSESLGGSREVTFRTVRHLPNGSVYLVLTSAPLLLTDQHPDLPPKQDVNPFPQALRLTPMLQSSRAEQKLRRIKEQGEVVSD